MLRKNKRNKIIVRKIKISSISTKVFHVTGYYELPHTPIKCMFFKLNILATDHCELLNVFCRIANTDATMV